MTEPNDKPCLHCAVSETIRGWHAEAKERDDEAANDFEYTMQCLSEVVVEVILTSVGQTPDAMAFEMRRFMSAAISFTGRRESMEFMDALIEALAMPPGEDEADEAPQTITSKRIH